MLFSGFVACNCPVLTLKLVDCFNFPWEMNKGERISPSIRQIARLRKRVACPCKCGCSSPYMVLRATLPGRKGR